MTLPAGVSTGTVTGTFVRPDGQPETGMVVFTPEVEYLLDSADNAIILPGRTVCPLNSGGGFSVVLPATDDTTLNPVNWTYEVEVKGGSGLDFTFSMALPSAVTVDLADVTPASPSSGALTYKWELFAEYTSPGTTAGVVLPAGVREARFILVGGGGGGGSGRRGLTSEICCGGGGGGGGAFNVKDVWGTLLTESFTLTLGTTSTGGASVAVDSTSGASAVAAGNSSITASTTGIILYTFSGTVGTGGGLGVAGAAGSGRAGVETGGTGRNDGTASSATGLVGPPAAAHMNTGPSGGGPGGGSTAANVAAGGGSASYILGLNRVASGGAVDTVGQAGFVPSAIQRYQLIGLGGGGGGGGASAAGPGAAGGAGGFPGGGGGGGGASSNGQLSGAGGDGGGSYAAILIMR